MIIKYVIKKSINMTKIKGNNTSSIYYYNVILPCVIISLLHLIVVDVNARDLTSMNELVPKSEKLYDTNELNEIEGDRILGERVIKRDESPYIVRTDLEIERGGKLVIEPGVTIYFAPMVGIIVRGILNAVGTPEDVITLTNQPDSGYENHDLKSPQLLGARLVDGPTPLEGRLQLNHGRWRSVCTNSRNWTIADYETACRQMGFQGGRFWNWVDRTYSNDPRLVYEEPRCRGDESSLFECAWSTRQIGSGVCDYHSDIGIQCLPLLEKPSSHWRGIQFDNAPSERQLASDNTNYESLSKSELRHVQIIKAGAGRNRMVNAAIDVLGVPPLLTQVLIDQSAYTGINVTRPDAAFKLSQIEVRRNHGIGIYINSSYGLAHVDNSKVTENGADGIRYIGHDLRSFERTDRGSIHDFCTLPITSGQTYPISVSVSQTHFSAVEKECSKYFITHTNYVLTVNFVDFTVYRNESARIEVFDGISSSDRLLGSWEVRNSTRPQSLTSTKNKIYIRFKAEARSTVIGFMRVTSGDSKSFDLNVSRTLVQDNEGRGVAVDNMRSQVHIYSSEISNSGHVAGLHVRNGAGDINVTDSKISFNRGDGVNITYFGGNRNISRSSISSNEGYGFVIWLNETAKDRQEFVNFNQTSVVEYSKIVRNLETGIRHGNFCGDFWVNITGNWFNDSLYHAVDIQTCWFNTQPGKRLQLQIGHNTFDHSHRIGVIISPALNLEGRIEHNHFSRGKYGALLVRNIVKDIPWEDFQELPVNLLVQHNHFKENQGVFVISIGLTPYSDFTKQYLLFTRNFVQRNRIKEPFSQSDEDGEGPMGEGRLNPRSRVAAPIVISSNNIEVFRNIISNPDSKYEVGSQFSDQSEILNVTYNWLGYSDEGKIFRRMFHRKDRYDLAKIQYYPFLLHNSNPGATAIMNQQLYVPLFHDEGSNKIGGEVDGQEILPSGTYTVERDINIRPGGKLTLQPQTTLHFIPNVGIMVSGKLEARGLHPDDILFTLKREPIMSAENETLELRDTELIDLERLMEDRTEAVTEFNDPAEMVPRIPVRLAGGVNDHEGRLQVNLDGNWGTVCDYGWSIENAALVCHQLGLALNPHDWRLQRNEVPGAGSDENVILSNVRCTDHDIDITKCRAERLSRGEFENSCPHENDVGIRCYPGAWAGLRFGVLAEQTSLQYVTVEQAGLFDYATNTFKPAVQMDFAKHNMENVRVVQNLHDGLGVIYSDIFGGDGINNVRNSDLSENRGSGVSLKQLGLKIRNSKIISNGGSGINHDSVLSAVEQRELAGWFHLASDFNLDETSYNPLRLPNADSDIDLDTLTQRHILTERHRGESIERTIHIRCQPRHVIGIQLLNPIQNRSTEQIFIYDSQNGNLKSDIWNVSRDLSVFPVTSSSYGIIMKYKSGESATGGTVFVLSTIPAPVQDIRNRIVRGPVPTLHVYQTKIQRNTRGVSATYYNRYLGQHGEHYLRKANESIRIVNCELTHNNQESIFLHAPFWDVHESNISEIEVHVNNTIIRDNGRGIHHFSKDLRSSNNLFHYLLHNTTIQNNRLGGLQLSLPYVWQYNENFTHSVYIGNSVFNQNKRFEINIAGHYAKINITENKFIDNECLNGLVTFKGMEKKLRIDNNYFAENNGKFIIEFNSDSQSEILGDVFALFTQNDMRHNKFDSQALMRSNTNYQLQKKYTRNPTASIVFNGIQKVRISRNLITDNDLDYDLVAGVKSARLRNHLDARDNWWGSIDSEHIRKRIFDFDDWNNHAEVMFRPFLIEDNVDGSVSIATGEQRPIDVENLGGRIFENFTLERRGVPYIIKSDITVMPGVTFTIRPGVVMEFAPNVGILVLGNLVARGYSEDEIVMRTFVPPPKPQFRRMERRSAESMVSHDTIRLCTNRNCTYDENEVERNHQGFLEYFNHTTLQWIPICDRRFTERSAQVVCRELGFDPLDTFFGHDRRIEYHTNSLTRIWSWVEPMECHGDEMRLEQCPERLNGQLYGRRHECFWDSPFVFVSCNGIPESKLYWGGIRFANTEFEQNAYENRIHDLQTHRTVRRRESHLEFVRVEGAGILHGEKSPGVQSIFRNPIIHSVTVRDCAHHGVNLISPHDAIHLNFLTVDNVLGHGINAISLTGEGRESEESSFTPLKALDLPYHLFSVLDMCDTSKEIWIEDRMIIYYKYDNIPVNCIKIFTSAMREKPLGFRLLQSNLFNHSKEYGRRDVLQMFDGDIYNISAIHIGSVEADSDNQKNLFTTKGPTLSVRLIASGAPAEHGFFAEVVTLPISAIGFNRDAQHNISNSEITRAVGGAVSYSTAGEVSPILTFDRNRIMDNCRQLYGNFSTCAAAIKVDVQNMQSLFFRNNLVQFNQGGLYIRADSRGSATSLRGFINHNLFNQNRNRPALYAEGRQSSPYQEVMVFKNYFAQNDAAFDNVIVLKQVVSNFTYNYVHRNRGGRIIEISGFDRVRMPIYQTTSHNGFYDNTATDWRGRATVVAGTAGQNYVDNIFFNPDNDYEMITVNQSKFDMQYWNSTLNLRKTRIDATFNFWNWNETLAVSGRIHDRIDDQTLLEITFTPFHMNNETILDGKCPPGWSLIRDTCYMYIGAPMSFNEARDFCRSDNASMPFIRGDRTPLWTYLERQIGDFRWSDRVWIQDLNSLEQCTTFVYPSVELADCNARSPFLCEIDPKVIIDPLSWKADVVAISVIAALICGIFILCCIGCMWFYKSRHRHTQRLQRRNSIRQSLRSLNSIDPQGSIRRRNLNMTRSTDTLTKSSATDYKKMTSDGSIESMDMDKSVLSSEVSYDLYNPNNSRPNGTEHRDVLQEKYDEYAYEKNKAPSKIYGIPEYKAPQGFELAYRNEGFKDNSTRSNSVDTILNEENPAIEDPGSDYYGNSSTLPLRGRELPFLSDLKQRPPEYEPMSPSSNQSHSSFLPSPPPVPPAELSYSNSSYNRKIDNLNFTPVENNYHVPDLRPSAGQNLQPTDLKRPDSYYTAVRSSKQPVQQSRPMQLPPPPIPSPLQRPKTIYEAEAAASNNKPKSYSRSKSEALLETNFDDEQTFQSAPLSAENRSHSQPLETEF